MISKTNLSHTRTEYCLFDECEERSWLGRCIKNGTICPECQKSLEAYQVSRERIKAAATILRWSRQMPWSHALSFALKNPLTTLLVGTALGYKISSVIAEGGLPEIGAIIGLSIAGSALYARYKVK